MSGLLRILLKGKKIIISIIALDEIPWGRNLGFFLKKNNKFNKINLKKKVHTKIIDLGSEIERGDRWYSSGWMACEVYWLGGNDVRRVDI